MEKRGPTSKGEERIKRVEGQEVRRKGREGREG